MRGAWCGAGTASETCCGQASADHKAGVSLEVVLFLGSAFRQAC